MSRTGLLVVIALIFALAAAGVLVWTNYFDLSGETTPTTASAPLSKSEIQAVKSMKAAAVSGGFAATFSGRDGHTWELASGHRLERFSLNGAEDVLARLTSSVPMDSTLVIDGLFVELPAEFSQRSNGQRVEIGVVARAGQSNPSADLSLLYATRQVGNSGWKTLKLTPAFQLHTITFDVPQVAEGLEAKPVIAVRGDNAGKGLSVELLGVYAKIVAPAPTAPVETHAFTVDFTKHHAEWVVPEGHKLSVVDDSAPLGRLVSNQALSTKDANLGSQGAAVLVPVETVQKLNGKKIEIAVRARAPVSGGSDKLWLMFATQQAGNSGWRSISLTPELQVHRLEYAIPSVPEGYSNPSIIVVQSDQTGSGRAADIESITIEPIE